MKTPRRADPALGARAIDAATGVACLLDRSGAVALPLAARTNPFSVPLESLAGAHVLLRAGSQLAAALALLALDGVAARLVIAPPDVKDEDLADVAARADLDTFVGEGAVAGLASVAIGAPGEPVVMERTAATQWVLFTSGTTGAPKMVAHSLEGLTGAIASRPSADPVVWGTFYDIRRYGGLQILLRAVLGGASLVLSDKDEPVADFLARLEEAGVTHLTGTPSHWRRALMSPAIARIAPDYVRLSGEIADQAVLDALNVQFPKAAIGHAYASTEAGVGFEVTDGLEGFPAGLIGGEGPVEMRVTDGTLRIRSPRTASDYVGQDEALRDGGFVDTGDLVELRGGRYHFMGRQGGIINVGGLKINPEEVEAVINRHPGVRMSRVSGRRNPITGAVVVAEVVASDLEPIDLANDNARFRDEIIALCRRTLPAFKVPAMLRFVSSLPLTAGGKLSRHA